MTGKLARLDLIFGALADPIRRDILERLRLSELNVSEVASMYHISLAATSKHLMILELAGLIRKRRSGKERMVSLVHGALQPVAEYLDQHARDSADGTPKTLLPVPQNDVK